MKHFEFRHANKPHMKALKLLVFFHILPLAAAYAQNDAFWETFPKDNGKALVNPHMGWTMHFYCQGRNNPFPAPALADISESGHELPPYE